MSEQHPEDMVAAAVKIGATSPCAKSKRGVVIFDSVVHSVNSFGKNHPAVGTCDGSDACRRDCTKRCVHAEQAALLKLAPCKEAVLLHIKVVDGKGVPGGPPSCIECSKLIVASGKIAHVWLWEAEGWVKRTAAEFHKETCENVGVYPYDAEERS